MSHFIYYFPQTSMGEAYDTFKKWKVSYACPSGLSHRFKTAVTTNGPNGRMGVLYQLDATAQSLQFVGKEQTWKRIPGSDVTNGGAWVGVWNDSHPTPADLLRPDATAGKFLTLGDGGQWLIPIGRFACDNANTGSLTPNIDIDEFGNIVMGEYSDVQGTLNRIAERLALSFIDAVEKFTKDNSPYSRFVWNIDDKDPFEILSANYRVSPAEIVLLKLFRWRDDAFKDICKTFIDSDSYLILESKKKADASPNTDVGVTDSSQTTNQP